MRLSQEELAARAGLHRTSVSHVERGGRNISLNCLVALANALEVEPWQLLRMAQKLTTIHGAEVEEGKEVPY